MSESEFKLTPLSDEPEHIPAVSIIHGWLALLRDNTEVPGQILHDQAVFLIRAIKSERQRVIQELREWLRNETRNNGDYSAVGAYNEVSEKLREMEAE